MVLGDTAHLINGAGGRDFNERRLAACSHARIARSCSTLETSIK